MRSFPLVVLILLLLPPGEAGAQSEVPDEPAAPTQEELEALGRQIQTTMMAGRPDVYRRLLDMDALLERTWGEIEAADEVKGGFAEGLKESGSLVDGVASQLGQGGSYIFRRVLTGGEGPRLLFRFLQPDGALNYHECLVHQVKDELRIVDIFPYLSGEWMSETFRRTFLSIATNEEEIREKGEKAPILEHLRAVRRTIRSLKAGRAEQALVFWKALPDEVKKEPVLCVIRIQIGQLLGEKEYLAAVAFMEKSHPGHPSLLLHGLDAYFLREKYDRVLSLLKKLNERVGPDGYVLFLMGNVKLKAGRIAEARAELERAMEVEPLLPQPHYGLIDLELSEKNWEALADALTRAEEKLGVTFDNLESIEGFEAFTKTDAYKAWKRRKK